MKTCFTRISALLFFSVVSAYAENTDSINVKDKFKKCCQIAKTTYDLGMCNNNEYEYYNTILNQKYKKLTSLLEKSRQEKLTLAQRSWLNYRHLDCDFAGLEAEGGSLQPIIIGQCRVERTKNRIKEINAYIKIFTSK